jgi:integrase/recombinase XerD
MDSVDRPRLPVIEIRALEPGELAIVLASARSLRDQAVLVLALDSGIRASEFGKLRVGDIGTESIWAWGKGNKRVRVPISPETHQLLQSLIKSLRRNSPQSLLFTDRHGRTISRFTVYRIVRQCMDHAGITGPKRGPHCLRHSLGKNYIEDGGDPFTLKRIMRHNSIATTQKYVNLAMRSVIDQHTIHSPVRHALQGAQGILISREVDEILEKR